MMTVLALKMSSKKKPESFAAQYKRRVVKTKKPEHIAKGFKSNAVVIFN